MSAPALDVTGFHDEWWDGPGYRLGLAGESIPFLARAFSVCGVFGALTSERPDKKAWPVEAALLETGAQMNRLFCFHLARAFSRIMGVCPGSGVPCRPARLLRPLRFHLPSLLLDLGLLGSCEGSVRGLALP
ncbi:HD domain-containing phosphohydrolase [Deinococcus hopiensis]|uniref:HD domain-containing phosphohydrolase n=1 Tax=Deinococcus hopiensis TaxID=309885 RepID=UPI000A03328A